MSARGLIVDYGGVLTPPVTRGFEAFERRFGLTSGALLEVVLDGYRHDADDSPVARLERGELDPETFETEMLERLRERGHEVARSSVMDLVFDGFTPSGPFWEVVAAARERGVATALLSNSWGTAAYPRRLLDEHFDAVVLSGEVGLRKPDPEIYGLAVGRLGVDPRACVYVDDLDVNVEVAESLGMTGVLYRGRDFDRVVRQVADGLGLSPADLGRPGAGEGAGGDPG